jgi:hypothetical protein
MVLELVIVCPDCNGTFVVTPGAAPVNCCPFCTSPFMSTETFCDCCNAPLGEARCGCNLHCDDVCCELATQ